MVDMGTLSSLGGECDWGLHIVIIVISIVMSAYYMALLRGLRCRKNRCSERANDANDRTADSEWMCIWSAKRYLRTRLVARRNPYSSVGDCMDRSERGSAGWCIRSASA